MSETQRNTNFPQKIKNYYSHARPNDQKHPYYIVRASKDLSGNRDSTQEYNRKAISQTSLNSIFCGGVDEFSQDRALLSVRHMNCRGCK